MLLLNGNFTLHGDISDYFPDVMKNDTTRFKIEIKGNFFLCILQRLKTNKPYFIDLFKGFVSQKNGMHAF